MTCLMLKEKTNGNKLQLGYVSASVDILPHQDVSYTRCNSPVIKWSKQICGKLATVLNAEEFQTISDWKVLQAASFPN
jgi:hypothetical protein